MSRGWARFADVCQGCLDDGRHSVYQPLGWDDFSNDGRPFHYLCRFGHSWTCWWRTVGNDPTFGEEVDDPA